MKGFEIGQSGHIVLAVPPSDITGGVAGDRFTMKNWGRASIIFVLGSSASAPTGITVLAYAAATGGSGEAIEFDVYKQETAAADVMAAKVAVATTGYVPTANDNVFYVIEIDGDKVPDGKPFIELAVTAAAAAILACAIVVLSAGRYQTPASATVLA